MDHLGKIAEKYPLKIEQPLDELADLLTSVIEGGIIMSKVLDEGDTLPNQVLHYRSHIRLVFGDA